VAEAVEEAISIETYVLVEAVLCREKCRWVMAAVETGMPME
jgi:hypothetical protein